MSLRRYYLFQATAQCTFFQAVFFLYYQQTVGLSMAAVLWLQSYFTALRAALDLPFGALADRTSRRACLVASGGSVLAGALLLLLWPVPLGAFLAETCFAAGTALRSGADSALLFDALEGRGDVAKYPRAESHGQAVAAAASGATAVVGGLLAAVDLRLPYLATAIAAAANTVVAGSLGADRPATHRHEHPLGTMVAAARDAFRSPALRWAIALATFAVSASHAYFFLLQPYLGAIGVPVALFGVVFAAIKVVTTVVAAGAHRVDGALGARGTTAVMTVVAAIGLGAMSLVVRPAGAVLLLTRGVLDGLWQPLTNVYVNRLVGAQRRATTLSLQNLISRLGLAAMLAVLAALVEQSGLRASLALVAAAVVCAGGALIARAPARAS